MDESREGFYTIESFPVLKLVCFCFSKHHCAFLCLFANSDPERYIVRLETRVRRFNIIDSRGFSINASFDELKTAGLPATNVSLVRQSGRFIYVYMFADQVPFICHSTLSADRIAKLICMSTVTIIGYTFTNE